MIRDRLLRIREPMRRLLVVVLGGTTVLLGLLTIMTPIPAAIFIPAGLTILSVEFVWAQRLLSRYQAVARRAAAALHHKKKLRESSAPGAAIPGSVPYIAVPSVLPGDQTQTPGA